MIDTSRQPEKFEWTQIFPAAMQTRCIPTYLTLTHELLRTHMNLMSIGGQGADKPNSVYSVSLLPRTDDHPSGVTIT